MSPPAHCPDADDEPLARPFLAAPLSVAGPHHAGPAADQAAAHEVLT